MKSPATNVKVGDGREGGERARRPEGCQASLVAGEGGSRGLSGGKVGCCVASPTSTATLSLARTLTAAC